MEGRREEEGCEFEVLRGKEGEKKGYVFDRKGKQECSLEVMMNIDVKSPRLPLID